MRIKYHRTEHPNAPQPDSGTAYDVECDGAVVGQVWQVTENSQTFLRNRQQSRALVTSWAHDRDDVSAFDTRRAATEDLLRELGRDRGLAARPRARVMRPPA